MRIRLLLLTGFGKKLKTLWGFTHHFSLKRTCIFSLSNKNPSTWKTLSLYQTCVTGK